MHLLNAALLSGGGIIDIDGTAIVQLVIFFVALVILQQLIFRPMVNLFAAREKAIDGARVEAKSMQKDAAEKAEAFDSQMQQVRQDAQKERDRLRGEGLRLERSIVDQVRQETQKTISDAEAEMEREASRIRKEMEAAVPTLARQMASRLLGREVSR